MTIILVEDERRAANVLQELIENNTGRHQILGVFDSVEQTVAYLKTASPQPDLLFLDIQLADGNGFDIFGRVPVQSAIIVCSSTEQFDHQGYKANIVGHVLKPVNPDDLARALAQAERHPAVARLH